MKKLLIAAAFVFSGTFVQAQIAQGTWVLGGGLGFSTETNDENDKEKVTNTNIAPEVGYFVKDDLMVALGFNMMTMKDESDADNYDETKSNMINIGVRKYWMSSEIFGFFAGLNVGFGGGSYEETIAGSSAGKTETSDMNVGLNGGFTFWPTSNIGLSAGTGVLSMDKHTMKEGHSNGKDDKVESTLTFDITNNVWFGVHWFFNQ